MGWASQYVYVFSTRVESRRRISVILSHVRSFFPVRGWDRGAFWISPDMLSTGASGFLIHTPREEGGIVGVGAGDFTLAFRRWSVWLASDGRVSTGTVGLVPSLIWSRGWDPDGSWLWGVTACASMAFGVADMDESISSLANLRSNLCIRQMYFFPLDGVKCGS